MLLMMQTSAHQFINGVVNLVSWEKIIKSPILLYFKVEWKERTCCGICKKNKIKNIPEFVNIKFHIIVSIRAKYFHNYKKKTIKDMSKCSCNK